MQCPRVFVGYFARLGLGRGVPGDPVRTSSDETTDETGLGRAGHALARRDHRETAPPSYL